MMRREIAVLAAALALGSSTAITRPNAPQSGSEATQTISRQIVGGWRLVSRITTSDDGRIVVDPGLSKTPTGVLIYDGFGHVAAQLSRTGRTSQTLRDDCKDIAQVKGPNDTAQTILGYDAYFGTYKVDEKEMTVTHHLESALFPDDVGKDILRHFSISGDTLVIKFSTTQRDGSPVTRTLTWQRMR